MQGWIKSSTQSLECYIYETAHGSALVFRHLGNGPSGYDVCIIDGYFRCADRPFLVLDEARAWAEEQLGGVLQERAVGE